MAFKDDNEVSSLRLVQGHISFEEAIKGYNSKDNKVAISTFIQDNIDDKLVCISFGVLGVGLMISLNKNIVKGPSVHNLDDFSKNEAIFDNDEDDV